MHMLQMDHHSSKTCETAGQRKRLWRFFRAEPERSFSWLLNDWLASIRPRMKSTTFSAYSTIAERHLRPAFGGLRISELTENDVCDFIAAQSAEPNALAPSTVRSIANVLRAVLEHGRSFGCKVEPGICRCSARGGKACVSVFSDAEQEKIVSYCEANLSHKNLGIIICLHTGLRLGEICALKWGDVSSEGDVLSVSRTLSRIRSTDDEESAATELFFGEPKSENSKRKIPLSPKLSRIMTKFRISDNCFILSGDAARPVEPRSMQRHFKSVLRKAGVADRNFHALRHTFATKCVERGFDSKALSLILGHSNVSVTLNTYVHPSIDRLRSMMALLDD